MDFVTYFCVMATIAGISVMLISLFIMKIILFIIYKATGGKKSLRWYWKHMKI